MISKLVMVRSRLFPGVVLKIRKLNTVYICRHISILLGDIKTSQVDIRIRQVNK